LRIDETVIDENNVSTWQAHIAHVPQSIFLADTSIAENIAFGVPADQIDYKRVRDAARQAQIAQIIENWDKKYQTRVGERGVRLSGGQRQRIGIARALYKNCDVIVLDEATSALDGDTESVVMEVINSLSDAVTVLIVAHRVSTLRNCSVIVELADGKVQRQGGYTDLFET
jgi:ATP-binding cassette subfamily B protein